MKKYLYILAALAVAACGGSGVEKGGTDVSVTLSAPQNVSLNRQTDHSLIFKWDAVNGAKNYEWQLFTGTAQVKSSTTVNTNAIVDGLTKGVSYSFQVRAVAGESVSSWSSAVIAVPGGDNNGGNNGNGNGNDDDDDNKDKDPVTESVYASFDIPSVEEDGVARAFPGAEGGGMYTTGGRGGAVLHVTNLNDSGEGSLRWAVNQSGPRTIVFDVAGVIELQSQLQIKNGDVTIVGQTAPGDGICIKNYTFRISASNVIVRFIRCRMGDEKKTEDDAIQVMDHTDDKYSNIIIDHCSVSWSTDECASFYGMKDFTFSWNIVSESLRVSIHEKGTHGYGGIWGGNNASYHHNLLAHHDSRNPRIDHDYVSTQKGPVSLVNNVIYNWRGNTCYGGESINNTNTYRKYNVINNYYKPGPATGSNIWFIDPTTSCDNCSDPSKTSFLAGSVIVPGHFYMNGNYMNGNAAMTADNWTGTRRASGIVSTIKAPAPFTTGNNSISVQTAQEGFDAVVAYAGASSNREGFKRDAVDVRVTTEAKSGTAQYKGSKSGISGLIDTQGDVGGWPSYEYDGTDSRLIDSDNDGIPDWFEDQFGLDKTKGSDASKIWLDKNGRYTNLEMYLHYIVKDIVKAQNGNGTYTKL